MKLEGRIGREKCTTMEGYRSGGVKYPSDGQFSIRVQRKRKRSREQGERKVGCSTRRERERERGKGGRKEGRERERERERERTVCSLDRIIAGESGFTSSRIASTLLYLELCSSSCLSFLALLSWIFISFFIYFCFLCAAMYCANDYMQLYYYQSNQSNRIHQTSTYLT